MSVTVCGFLFSPDGQRVALIRKARPEWCAGRYNGVGGKVEAGETPLAAMVREFREETGIATAESDWTHCVTLRWGGPAEADRRAGGIVYFYRARPWLTGPAPELVCAEDEPVGWYRRDILPMHCVPNLYWLVPLCFDRGLRFPVEVADVATEEPGKAGPA